MLFSIVIDWKRTLYDPDNQILIEGAHEVLSYIKGLKIPLYLIGKGGDDMHDEVARLQLAQYFDDMLFVGEKKQHDDFKRFISEESPEKTLIIGDKISSEIEIGNELGVTTIQVRQGKFANDSPDNDNQKPDVIVSNLLEVIPAINSFL